MSAIWGVVSRETNISTTVVSNMQNSMKEFFIDRYDGIIRGSVYFACGLQYFTKTARSERLPIYDESRDTYFTADCVLTNRDEIIRKLGTAYSKETLKLLGDGELSYKAYLQFGERFAEYLRGSFSFVIYNVAQKELLLYADHFARRYLAYYVSSDKVCFSTVYQPLLAVLDKSERKPNKHWIAAAYTDCTADTIKLPGATAYENIYHVEPGQYVKINTDSQSIEKCTYWKPLTRYKKLRLKSDEEYRELFLTTFRKAVSDLLCVDGEVGIMLSGGLDSSSVAAFAAEELQNRKQKLFSYTAVPSKDYTVRNTHIHIEDETNFVLDQQRMHPNIYPQFISSDDVNVFTNINNHVSCYMEPVKPILNMVNTHEMIQQASRDGCKLMLTGQNGNATISYGRVLTYIYQKLRRFRFREAYREFVCFCKMHHISKKYFMKVFFRTWKEEHCTKYTPADDCFLKQEDISAYNIISLERTILKQRGNGCMDTEQQRNNFCFMPLVYQHMGFYDTYGSLRYGILSVDPTLTKEVLELCLCMPVDCFVKNGKERRVVRDYMKGYVPDSILDNHAGRGVQAADFAFRVNRDFDVIREVVYTLLDNPKLLEYLDKDKLQELRNELRQNEGMFDKSMVARAAVIASLSAFLNQIDEYVIAKAEK